MHMVKTWPDKWSQGYLKQATGASNFQGFFKHLYTCSWVLALESLIPPDLLVELLLYIGFSNPDCS